VEKAESKKTLSFHAASGNFCKKVKGKRFYLGKVEHEALATWELHKESFLLGIDPRKEEKSTSKRLTLRDAVNAYLAAQESRVESGEIRERTFKDALGTCKRMVAHLGKTIAVESLRPSHFSKYKSELAKNFNVNTLSNEITRARSVFIWLAESKKIASRPDFGPDFKRAKKRAIRRHRQGQADKVLSPEAIRMVLGELSPQYRAMAFLGINCGFGPTDCMELPMKAVDLESGWIEYPRTKTAIDRKCPLWDETSEALDHYDKWRAKPEGRGAKKFFFLRHDGTPFTETNSNITRNFTRALKIVGHHSEGLSFYAMRHTLGTIARQVRDDDAVKVIFGHVDDSMLSEHYTHEFPEDRLQAVADHVRAVVLGSGGKAR